MKRPISITLTILSLLLVLGTLRLRMPATTTGAPLPALQGEAALNHLKEQGLYGSLQEAVTAARYGFYQESKQSAAWLADNHAQRLRARFTPDGLQVETSGDWGRPHRLTQQQKLSASSAAANDEFGKSVAISGETIVIGAPAEDGDTAVGQGSAYVFMRSGGVRSKK